METYIDDLAGGWATDIDGEPVQIGRNTNRHLDGVVLPDTFVMPSKVTIDSYTPAGQAKLEKLMKLGYDFLQANKKLVNGVHFHRKIIPFSEIRELYPDPFNFDGGHTCNYGNHQVADGKRYKQAPLRVKH